MLRAPKTREERSPPAWPCLAGFPRSGSRRGREQSRVLEILWVERAVEHAERPFYADRLDLADVAEYPRLRVRIDPAARRTLVPPRHGTTVLENGHRQRGTDRLYLRLPRRHDQKRPAIRCSPRSGLDGLLARGDHVRPRLFHRQRLHNDRLPRLGPAPARRAVPPTPRSRFVCVAVFSASRSRKFLAHRVSMSAQGP